MLTGLNGYLIGGGAILAVWLLTIVKAVLWGKSTERNAQKAKEVDSYEKSLKDLADAAVARPTGSLSDDPHNRDR